MSSGKREHVDYPGAVHAVSSQGHENAPVAVNTDAAPSFALLNARIARERCDEAAVAREHDYAAAVASLVGHDPVAHAVDGQPMSAAQSCVCWSRSVAEAAQKLAFVIEHLDNEQRN